MSDETAAEATRRQFFRLLGRQTAARAGNVLGTVDALRQTSVAAATELLGLAPDGTLEEATAAAATPGQQSAQFRSPYRYADDALLILDQRRLPDRLETITCHDASEVAAAMRAGAVGGGPVLGQLAAHAAALTVARLRGRPTTQRRHALRGAATTLRAARPSQRAIRYALKRIESVDQLLDEEVDGAEHFRALFDEAEAIAMAAALEHGRLGRSGAGMLMAADEQAAPPPLALLVHGDGGPLAAGMVGTSFAVLSTIAAAGRQVHAWLTEVAPTLEGARLGARQLADLGIEHTIIADTAVSWLLQHRHLDAALLRADWVCANGDTAAPIGSLNVARLAAAAGVAVFACAPVSLIDMTCSSGAAIPSEFRPPADGSRGPRLDPTTDVVPAELLTALITDAGVVRPPYAESLPAAAGGTPVEARR